MPSEFTLVREVEFCDTDMAGIMHFSNYFRFMEATEHAFFRSLGLSIHTTIPEPVGWPRVRADCEYLAPLQFEDRVAIRLQVREKRERSLRYSFSFRKLNAENSQPEREVARGIVIAVCVQRDPSTGRMVSRPIPKAIADLIEVAPEEPRP